MSGLTLTVPLELVEAVASRVVALLEERFGDVADIEPWMDVEEAAAHIAAKPQRIYDLVNQRRLSFARDGRRLVFRRCWLDEYLERARPAA